MPFDIRRARRTETAPYICRRLSPDPQKPITLHVRHLGATNPAYIDALFTRVRADRKEGSAAVAADREEDVRDLAAYCIAGWDNLTSEAAPVVCTPESALAFLEYALANGYEDEIDLLRSWAKIQGNFREPAPAAETVGKP